MAHQTQNQGYQLMIKPTPKYVDKRTDKEWLENYYSRNPIYTKEVFMRAIVIAVEAEANLLGVEVDISDEIASKALDSSGAGVPIGVGNESTRKETTLKLYNNGQKSGSVKRNGKEIDSFSYTAFGASFKWFKESEDPIPLDVRSYMRQATEELGLVGKGGNRPNPELMKQRMEEQMALDKIQAEFTAKSNALSEQLDATASALFKFEYTGVEQVNMAAGIKPHMLSYPKRKHTGFNTEQLDSAYEGALASPNGFNFLTTGDVMEDPRIKAVKGDRLKVAQVKLEVLEEHLGTYVAHLKHADEKHSFEDEPHPLITAWEAKNGTARSLTDEELERTAIIELSNKELKSRLASTDPKDAVFSGDMIVPAINVNDLGNPDADIVAGQMFTGSRKLTPKHLSISGKVKVVGGDHTKPVDGIFLAEGVATAATLEEMTRYAPEYKDKNILVLSSFDVGNFKKTGVELHHKFPNTPITAVADNDVKIVVDTGNRPVLAKDGGYSYITRDKQIISGSEMPSNPKAQIDKLAKNVGAESARFLNKYAMDNPNRNPDGSPIKPQLMAFVANKGEGLTDYLITPASADPTGNTPIEERLLSPKQDLNDVVQNQKRVIRAELKREFANAPEKVTNEVKAAKTQEAMQDLATTLIINPANTVKPQLDAFFDKRLAAGAYDQELTRPDVDYEVDQEQAIAQQNISDSNYAPVSIDTSAIPEQEPSVPVSTSGVKSKALSDSAPQKEPTPEALAAFAALEALEKLEAQEKNQQSLDVELSAVQSKIDEHVQQLFDVELKKLIISNEGYEQVNEHGVTEKVDRLQPHDFKALKDAHPSFTNTELDTLYNRSLAMPDEFDFLKFEDVDGTPPTHGELVNRLGRVINNLEAHGDYSHLVDDYESTYGVELPDMLTKDEYRVDQLHQNPALARPETSTQKVFIPTFDINRLHSSNGAEIAGGFVLEDGKLTPASHIDLTNQVNLVSGTPEKELTSIIVTSSHADAVQMGYDLRHNRAGHDYTLVSAMNIDNFKEIGVKLADANLGVFVTMVAENNIDVKLDANKQPILTNGDYTFTSTDGKDMTAAQIKSDPKELAFQLEKNEGAKAVEYLKEQFLERPARTDQGYVAGTYMSAIVSNQGETSVDLISSPLSYVGKIDQPNLDPSAGYKGISENLTAHQTKTTEEKNISLIASDQAPLRVNKAGISQLLLNKYVVQPADQVRQQLNDTARSNDKAGYYQPDAISSRMNAAENAEKERRAGIVNLARYHMEQLDKVDEVISATTSTAAHSTNSGFSANIRNSNIESLEKQQKSSEEISKLAEKFTNSYVNTDILKALNLPAQESQNEPSYNQKPQEELVNMNRPSPR